MNNVGTGSVFQSDLRRIFSNPKIYISFLLSLSILLRPLAETLYLGSGPYSFVYLQSLPFGLSDYTPFAAIFCVIPFSDSFCEDYNFRFTNAIISRISPKKYARQRSLSTALAGGFLMGAVVFTVLLICFFAADTPDTAETVRFLSQSLWAEMDVLVRYHGLAFFAYRVLFGFLFGCLWASVGLCISTIVTNRYVTFVAPFVIYQTSWFLIDNLSLNPVQNLRGDYAYSVGFVIVYQLILIGICISLSSYGIWKKVTL